MVMVRHEVGGLLELVEHNESGFRLGWRLDSSPPVLLLLLLLPRCFLLSVWLLWALLTVNSLLRLTESVQRLLVLMEKHLRLFLSAAAAGLDSLMRPPFFFLSFFFFFFFFSACFSLAVSPSSSLCLLFFLSFFPSFFFPFFPTVQ